ncbi:MAG: LamG-like jellyroll fold domain-containing protein [Thermoplasmatota archaeon]
MTIRILQKNPYAVSEVIGGILLVFIAVAAAVAIYNQMLPVPLPTPEPNVLLRGYVTEHGNIIIEHVGGDTLHNYEVYINGTFYTENPPNTLFSIGDKIGPISSMLYDEHNSISLSVYTKKQDGSNTVVFDGILLKPTQGYQINPLYPFIVTSLKTNTVDEDIICYADPQKTNQTTQTYIYNWTKNGNPFAKLIYAFDVDNINLLKDYSGNNYHGQPYNISWAPNGIIGGSYYFNQTGHISLPSIFSSPYIGSFTLETWIKSTQQSSSIISFNHGKCFELVLSNGKPLLSTHANEQINDLLGSIPVNDGEWRHIAASYNHQTGISKIYVDGEIDGSEQAHSTGSLLGDGNPASGFIGKGDGASQEEIFSTSFETTQELNQWKEDEETWGGGEVSLQWETYYYDNFESGWGNWISGGWYSSIDTSGAHAYEGTNSVRLRWNRGWSSSTYTYMIPAQSGSYTEMSIDFHWKAVNLQTNEQLQVLYYDGSTAHHVESFTIGQGYSNSQFYHSIVTIDNINYPFTNGARFVLRSQTGSTNRNIYIDHIYVNVTSGTRVDYEIDLISSQTATPHSGSYSLAGSGDFQPEYAYFNRTAISLAGYNNVEVSIWYSYKDTTNDDSFGLFYKEGSDWIPVFNLTNINIGTGQSDWTCITTSIPDSIDDLILQFRWSTSSSSRYVMIDDLTITGNKPGGSNYHGFIDEIKIYSHELSEEQIYQNYLQTKKQSETGMKGIYVIVASETNLHDQWQCFITPNDGQKDYALIETNIITIRNY